MTTSWIIYGVLVILATSIAIGEFGRRRTLEEARGEDAKEKRKCLRCGATGWESGGLRVSGTGWRLVFAPRAKLWGRNVRALSCIECGHLELMTPGKSGPHGQPGAQL